MAIKIEQKKEKKTKAPQKRLYLQIPIGLYEAISRKAKIIGVAESGLVKTIVYEALKDEIENI